MIQHAPEQWRGFSAPFSTAFAKNCTETPRFRSKVHEIGAIVHAFGAGRRSSRGLFFPFAERVQARPSPELSPLLLIAKAPGRQDAKKTRTQVVGQVFNLSVPTSTGWKPFVRKEIVPI
jgi:hypothetical protein